MALNPRDRTTTTATTAATRTDTRRWIIYAVVAIVVLLVLLWLFGVFDGGTDTATTPAPATTEEGATVPAAPAAPQ